MPRAPRIRFIRLAGTQRTAWLAHSARVEEGIPDRRLGHGTEFVATAQPDPAASGPAAELVVWELLSTNNRVLVRSAHSLGSFAEALADGRACRAAAADGRITARYLVDSDRGGQGFVLVDGEDQVATCHRWYAQQRKCLQSARVAIASLAVADLAAATLRYDDGGSGRSSAVG